MYEPAGYFKAAAHAAGIGFNEAVGPVRKVYQGEHLVYLGIYLPPGHAVEHGMQVKVLPRGQQVVDAGLLENYADVLAHLERLGGYVVPGYQRGAGGGLHQGGQHAYQGSLAGAVGAEQAEHFPLGYFQRHAVYGGHLGVALDQVLCFNSGHN